MGDNGAWRSLVAHWHGGPGVSSSNLLAPTNLLLRIHPADGRWSEFLRIVDLRGDKERHGERGAAPDLGVQ